MNISVILKLTLMFWCVSSLKLSTEYVKPDLDSIFINWNGKSMHSLDSQRQSISDSIEMNYVEDRISIFKGFWGYKNLKEARKKSIRYTFLEKLLVDGKWGDRDYYIIESNQSGSKVVVRNFVLYLTDDHKAQVDLFIYSKGDWVKIDHSSFDNFHFGDELHNDMVQFGLGVNDDDIIISKFRGNLVANSVYYLYSTLSKKSFVKPILDSFARKKY